MGVLRGGWEQVLREAVEVVDSKMRWDFGDSEQVDQSMIIVNGRNDV